MTPAELRAAAALLDGIEPAYGSEANDRALSTGVAAARRLADIQEAWVDPGPMPSIHRNEQNRLRRYWPTLARAIERSIR